MTEPHNGLQAPADSGRSSNCPAADSGPSGYVYIYSRTLPTAADLDAMAEEQRVAKATEVAEPCCVGVDMPGVGHEHSHDCAQRGLSVRRSNRPYMAGVVPEPLREYVDLGDSTFIQRRARRQALMAQLVFAARDLALGNVQLNVQGDHCTDCGIVGAPQSCVAHAENCATFRVLQIICELMGSVTFDQVAADELLPGLSFDPKRKESATDGEAGRAGDGIRPRGLDALFQFVRNSNGGAA